MLLLLALGSFFWDKQSPSFKLQVANGVVTAVNICFIFYETQRWSRVVLRFVWIAVAVSFSAVQYNTLAEKNPVALSGVAFAFRLVMLCVVKK